MKNRRFAGLVVVFVLLLVFGCNNPTGTDISLDEEAIQDYILSNEDGFLSFDAHYGAEDTLSGNSLRAIPSPTTLWTWWREPQDANRQISINTVNDSAFVTISNRVEGVFHILEIDTSATPDIIIHYEKTLGDNFISYAIFKRYLGVLHHRGWMLVNLTGAEVNSDSVEVAIDSIRINCESYEDTLLTTPLVFFHRQGLLTFGREEEVTLTVYSDDDVYAYLHAYGGGYWRRWRFTEIESGVWQGVWLTPLVPGVRVAAFDVLHKNTIDDEVYKYDSNVWILPYLVE